MSENVKWSRELRASAAALIRAALHEDMRDIGDLTSKALVAAGEVATVLIVARQNGVVCGLPIAEMVFEELDDRVRVTPDRSDSDPVESGTTVAEVSGPVRSLLAGERTALNFMTHLSGIATLTREFVQRVDRTNAEILDTRKTLPGYRLLQKYAVACGGGTNHRFGLYDGVLIKDNHLAAWSAKSSAQRSVADAIRTARESIPDQPQVPVEVEVDTLEQFVDAIDADPDIVLLDNMTNQQLREAVEIRDREKPEVRLEASGGVNLDTVRGIAETGVDRISIGALTHSAPATDLAFDWKSAGRP